MPRPATRPLRVLLAAGLTAVLAGTALGSGAATAGTGSDADRVVTASASTSAAAVPGARQRRDAARNPVTPGDFTGYGFDQCLTPDQKSMNTWLRHSPFLAVGIYISGDSRACRNQPNLTPRWVRNQLRKGWRLLPITLGPQASCQPRFPRYDDDYKISPRPGRKGRYGKARRMGRQEAVKAVAAAQQLGIVPGSTLWYDLEGYDSSNTHCRESALSFLHAWTNKLHTLDYVSGVYSSAGSGIRDLDDARVQRPGKFTLPDMIWVARWDGRANTSTDYIREDGWRPGGRVKQYQGGHDETWGGVRINIDRNFLDVGKGSHAPKEEYCGGVRLAFPDYPVLRPATDGSEAPPANRVRALQCLLQQQGLYAGRLHGRYTRGTVAGVGKWQEQSRGRANRNGIWHRRDWVSLLAAGDRSVLKIGSAGGEVRRLQRALNAASPRSVGARGVYNEATRRAVLAYQHRLGLEETGIAAGQTWRALRRGRS